MALGALAASSALAEQPLSAVALAAPAGERASEVSPEGQSRWAPSGAEDSLWLQGPLTGEWKLAVGSMGLLSENDEKLAAVLEIQPQFSYRFHEQLQLKTSFFLNFSSEREQTAFANTELEGRVISLRQAEVEYSPFEFLKFSAGAVSQACCYLSDLVISGRQTFPGVTQSLSWAWRDNLKLEARAQQTIPTSRSQSSQRQEREPLPAFVSESLALLWSPTVDLGLEAFVTHYRFYDLPAQVAFVGRERGNTILDPTPGRARFQEEFNGYILGAASQFRPGPRWELRGALESIHNLDAPATYGRGEKVSMGLSYDFGSWVFSPQYFVFYNESDTAPAFYNSGSLGHNNRRGQGVEFTLDFRDLGFALRAHYVQSDLINDSDRGAVRYIQVPQQYFFIKLETNYADI